MFTAFLMTLPKPWRVLTLVLGALLLVPSLTFAVSYSEVVELFKYTYGSEKLITLMSLETVLFNLLKRKKKTMGGRGQWITPYEIQNGGVFVGMSEGATLTTRRAQPDTGEATFSLIEFQGVWDITWKMLRMASKSADAMVSAMNYMDKSIRRRILRVINAQLCSFTGLGELAILPDADDQTTITVNSLPFIDKGMYVDLIDASDNTTALVSARTATSLNVQSRTVTISGGAPAGTAAGDFFVPSDQVVGGAHLSLNGMGAWISNANPPSPKPNLGGINRSTAGNDFYQGNLLENGGVLRAFTEDLLIDGENLMRERGGVQPSRYIANGNIAKRYHGDVVKDRYFAMNKIEAADKSPIGWGREGVDLENSESGTGKTNYTLSGKPFHIEPYLRANRVLGWNDNHFFIGHDGIEMPTPISEVFDGMVSHFSETGASKFDVWHYWEAELISDNPQAGIQFQDIAES
jgi:hypothetical protein